MCLYLQCTCCMGSRRLAIASYKKSSEYFIIYNSSKKQRLATLAMHLRSRCLGNITAQKMSDTLNSYIGKKHSSSCAFNVNEALTLKTMIVSTDSFSRLCIHGVPKKSSQQNSLETALIYCGCRLQTWMKVFWPWLTYLLDLLVPRATISLLCLQTPSSMNQNIFTKFCWLHFLEHPVPLHLPTYSSIISPPLECKHHH